MSSRKCGFFFSFISPLDPFMAIFRAKYESFGDFVFSESDT